MAVRPLCSPSCAEWRGEHCKGPVKSPWTSSCPAAPGACRAPQGRSLSQEGALGRGNRSPLLPSQWYCLRPESEVCVCPVLLPGGDICQPCYGRGENRVFTSLCPCCSRPLQRKPPLLPCRRALGVSCVLQGGPCQSPQPLHRRSALTLGRSSCPGLLQLMDWPVASPKISALGVALPP